MGSTVIIAIKHDQARVYDESWPSAISTEMNWRDDLPKSFGEPMADTGYQYPRNTPLRAEGILVSAYKDNEYEQNLYINHDLMMGIHALSLRESGKVIDSESAIIKSLKKLAKGSNYPFGRYMKAGKLFPNFSEPYPTVSADSCISLFSIQTDTFDSRRFSTQFRDILRYVEAGLNIGNVFGSITIDLDRQMIFQSGGDVEFLGTLLPDTAAIVHMDRGWAKVIKIPNRVLNFNVPHLVTKDSKPDPLIVLANSFGIQFEPLVKKIQDRPEPQI